MPLFRINSDRPFNGPHQEQPILEAGAPPSRAKAAMIMLHGRGATAKSILWLSGEFAQPDVRYLAPQADTHTWYPHPFTDPIEKNQPHLSSALQMVHDLIQQLVDEGISRENIVLLGFSQGACLALEYAARHPLRLGGVVGLSGGLIGPKVDPNNYFGSLEQTPVFMGVGKDDTHISVDRVEQTATIMNQLDGMVTKEIYPDPGHKIYEEEVKFVRGLLSNIIHSN